MKAYLGDSVYAEFDGFHIVLTTNNGEGPTNTICLEPAVMDELWQYQQRLAQAIQTLRSDDADEQRDHVHSEPDAG
jgi:hypothetical protein